MNIMSKKIGLVLVIALFTLCFISCNAKDQNSNSDYPPMIYWNDQVYIIQDINKVNVTENELGDELGEVTEVISSSEKPAENGVSNEFEIGSKIFSIIDTNDDAIAIAFDSKYYVAYPIAETDE